MSVYHLAIDIGASGGRHFLGHLEHGRMMLEEVHRFENGIINKDGELCWDLVRLFEEIKTGMKKCKEIGKIPASVGIDTWGVDFVLLDKNGQVIGNSVAYRDSRTNGIDEKVYSIIPEEALYQRTGIQKQSFNTIYQLMAVKEKHPQQLQNAKSLLMIPDYLHYLLCGNKRTEYTNATTTQLVSPETKDWDREMIDMLGFPPGIFRELVTPGTVLGSLTEAIQAEVGYHCKVVVPATHDTGSAVIAVPSIDEHTLYISSGTWSLMGIEQTAADCSLNSKKRNFTNEGGYLYRFRYLKNIMGLWMIQSVKKELDIDYSYAELCDMASKESIASVVDCNNSCFLAPKSMSVEIRSYCRDTNQQEPATAAELAAVIYNSLAICYGNTIKEIEEITGHSYDKIHVVGGGANAEYLNQLTARHTGRKVLAGPSEATAIGNLMVQMLQNKELKNLHEAKACVWDSFAIKTYEEEKK